MKLGILATHPIQYHAPLFRELAGHDGVDLTVFFAHRPTPAEQGAGFGVDFVWDVDLLSGYRHQFLQNVARSPAKGFAGYDTPKIASIIAGEKFDFFIVHGWNNRSCWQAFRACWRTGTPLAVRSDSQLPQGRMTAVQLLKQGVKRLVYRHFIRRFDLCLPYGQRSAEYFRHYGARQVAIAPHFVDNDYFARQVALHAPRRGEFRRRWGIPADACCFLFCGKFIAQKRPMDILHALKMLLVRPGHQQDAEPSRLPVADAVTRPIYLLMVGDGALRRDCEHFATLHQLPVSFAGFLNQGEIVAAYAAVDCLVLSSESETWGLVVNEAMAGGLPVIVSDACGCVQDLIKDGVTGSVYPAGETASLAWVMANFAGNLHLARQLSISAIALIDRFTASVGAEIILNAMLGSHCDQ